MIRKFQGDYRWLSNFYPSVVEIDGKKYSTVEHGYQSIKTLDLSEREKIRLCQTPGQSKRLGRKVKIREDWEEIKVSVMLGLLRQKFFFHKELRDLLLQTGEEELVEGNTWHDNFWGVCECGCGIGQNTLGILLMQVRSEIRRLRK